MSDEPAALADPLDPSHLRTLGLFGALSDDALALIAATAQVRHFQPGEIVFQDGDHGRELYVVLEGELSVYKRTPAGHELKLSGLTAGQWFGEMSILDVQHRFATVRVVTPSRLLLLTARDLDALYRHDLKSYTLLVLNLARELSRRLRTVDQLVFDLVTRIRDHHLGCG